jgi:adenylylsulfate reductase subunit B
VSILIEESKCTGCGACTQVCPGSLLKLQDAKAKIAKPERCWGCCSCLKECPVQAIALYLGEDMGGRGGRMHVQKEGHLLHWIAALPGGATKIITVDSRDSNKY